MNRETPVEQKETTSRVMRSETFDGALGVDTDQLHSELKAALGDDFIGISTADDEIVILLSLTSKIRNAELLELYHQHDPTKKPPVPRQSIKEELALLEAAYPDPLDTSDYKGELRALADHIRMIELRRLLEQGDGR